MLETEEKKSPITLLVAEEIDVDVKAAVAYGYSMEVDTKQPNGDGSDTV